MTLYVLSGLPGVGKTTVARALARATGAVYLRIDSIEQPLLDADWPVQGEGYAVAQAIARDNLRLGRSVVADCVNPWPLTRSDWQRVGERAGAVVINVEVVCSDVAEHRRRVESRATESSRQRPPTWDEVMSRDYLPWDGPRIKVDTAAVDADECVRRILDPARSAGNGSGES